MQKYKAFFFDLDGTLVNSEPLKGEAIARACRELGAESDVEYYKAVMGQDWPTVTGHFFKLGNITPTMDAFNTHFRKHYENLLSENLNLNPGVDVFIRQAKTEGKRCAVVSSAAAWMVENILSQLNLKGCFDLIISNEDVSRHKPDPEAYLVALEKFDLSPQEALIFEDSSAGIEAGKRSGCDVIAIRHDFNIENDMTNADSTINSFDELSMA
ncbi:beta-phosphoglucomutase [Veronia nyctiphanis]|uniref:Beta-phosphoglucomutase n=1 Tax=Veronia nyctiphanis TaxID=1278244 RepID=A0A4V1LT61_9GAMM|nr:HAD family phosphatase [Veronia nyctiphanis]RXJ74078.1 beta-phosphoglucomutase [Veronia nyctiphanis]